MVEGQRIILGATEEEMTGLTVRDIVVPFEDLGDAKPSINQISDCVAEVTTYSQPQVRKLFVKFLIEMDC